MFRQDCTCPALLKSPVISIRTGLSPAKARLSSRFRFNLTEALAWSRFARHYYGSLC
jgi:hypothetical protein